MQGAGLSAATERVEAQGAAAQGATAQIRSTVAERRPALQWVGLLLAPFALAISQCGLPENALDKEVYTEDVGRFVV